MKIEALSVNFIEMEDLDCIITCIKNKPIFISLLFIVTLHMILDAEDAYCWIDILIANNRATFKRFENFKIGNHHFFTLVK
jgi:hypothetical protein